MILTIGTQNCIRYDHKQASFINKIESHIGEHIIKVLFSMRRFGKGYLILSIIDRIKQLQPDANNIYINKEHYEFDHIRNYHNLQAYFDEQYKAGNNNYLFIDEIQEFDQFEKCIRNILFEKIGRHLRFRK